MDRLASVWTAGWTVGFCWCGLEGGTIPHKGNNVLQFEAKQTSRRALSLLFEKEKKREKTHTPRFRLIYFVNFFGPSIVGPIERNPRVKFRFHTLSWRTRACVAFYPINLA